ncbi:hypothetical protein MTR_1g022300 [Medicago truncatula]|uniref:Transmembrane protein n=1 Tax=Medicago truncatula TaxID=3880 RepID=A0A072VDP8_MEDTR|nr:hypothetical protein MTR_1g022300 [Medicago truncatula]
MAVITVLNFAWVGLLKRAYLSDYEITTIKVPSHKENVQYIEAGSCQQTTKQNKKCTSTTK